MPIGDVLVDELLQHPRHLNNRSHERPLNSEQRRCSPGPDNPRHPGHIFKHFVDDWFNKMADCRRSRRQIRRARVSN